MHHKASTQEGREGFNRQPTLLNRFSFTFLNAIIARLSVGIQNGIRNVATKSRGKNEDMGFNRPQLG
jgi:hypothetical protein